MRVEVRTTFSIRDGGSAAYRSPGSGCDTIQSSGERGAATPHASARELARVLGPDSVAWRPPRFILGLSAGGVDADGVGVGVGGRCNRLA